MNCDQLTEWNRRGLIPGPDEPEEDFFQRCSLAQKLRETTECRAKKRFDIDPDWVSIEYSNKGLRFWEGACTWIEDHQTKIQLKKGLKTKDSIFGYRKEEIISHELVHVVRSQFEEPVFEEVFAYHTSFSSFRRCFGPFFRSPKEVWLLFSSCFASFFQWYLLVASFSLAGLGTLRLFRAHKLFRKAQQKLSEIFPETHVFPVMLRLTDREIIRFSCMPKEKILNYCHKMEKTHLRWKQIMLSYSILSSNTAI